MFYTNHYSNTIYTFSIVVIELNADEMNILKLFSVAEPHL